MPTATTALYTLSLHDALPILRLRESAEVRLFDSMRALRDAVATATARREYAGALGQLAQLRPAVESKDRKSTRLNSSHVAISYAVFCLKKKTSTTVRYYAGFC